MEITVTAPKAVFFNAVEVYLPSSAEMRRFTSWMKIRRPGGRSPSTRKNILPELLSVLRIELLRQLDRQRELGHDVVKFFPNESI